MVTRRTTFRLYPSQQQSEQLLEVCRLHQYLYNAAIADRRDWTAHTSGTNGYLELKDLGIHMSMRGKARTWGTPTTCTLLRRHGKWYASITVNCVPQRQTGTGAIGIDLGCKDAVTFSEGTKIAKPQFIADAEAGGFYLESPTRNLKPTQRCAMCWELTPKTLSDRIHQCSNPQCNHTEDRDVNGAQVNLAWAKGLERPSSRREVASTDCGSMKQVASRKRAKLRLLEAG